LTIDSVLLNVAVPFTIIPLEVGKFVCPVKLTAPVTVVVPSKYICDAVSYNAAGILVVPVIVLPKLLVPVVIRTESVKDTAPVVVSPVSKLTPLLLSVSVVARANHEGALKELVNVTAPIAVGCVAAFCPTKSWLPIRFTANVEIAQVVVLLPPIVNVLEVVLTVVPVMVTDVALLPKVREYGFAELFESTAPVHTSAPPTDRAS
jgi:hypothetical protein